MDFVLDCSVTMAWCFEDQVTPYSETALEALSSGQALVPSVWPLEVANVLLVAERHGRMKPADSARFLSLLQGLPIAVDRETSEHAWNDVLHTAGEYRLSSYDGAYLDLSMRAGVQLATLDRRLRKAAEEAGLPLFPGADPGS